MEESRLRAPLRILEELLGDADEDPGLDKSSTLFLHWFEGEAISVFDFHKPEWSGTPECRTDPNYVWTVYSEGHDVTGFCRWLSVEVAKRVSGDAEAYRWPLPGDPQPSPPPPPKPAPKAIAPKLRARAAQAPPPALDAHRKRVLALQGALDDSDAFAIAELEADLSRLGVDAQKLAELIARQPELPEAEVRERIGRGYPGACAEIDRLLRSLSAQD